MIEFLKIENTDFNLFDKSDDNAKYFYHFQGWADFLMKVGYEIEIYVIKKDKELLGNFFIEYHRRRFTKYGYIPAGFNIIKDLSKVEESEIYASFSEFLQKKVKEKKVRSLRFDYFGKIDLDNTNYDISLAVGLPKYSWEIDLTQDLETLRHQMSNSTRHNINKCEKNELITVKKADTSKQLAEFYNLMSDTTKRKGFINFNIDYFNQQFSSLKGNLCDLYICYYNHTPISAAWINYGSDTVFYTHGASTSEKELSKLRSPYLLQWKIIVEAKERGFKKYNMWGVLPDYLDNSDLPLKGVSEFKKSFGGDYLNSRGVFEVYSGFFGRVLTRLYDWWLYRGDRY